MQSRVFVTILCLYFCKCFGVKARTRIINGIRTTTKTNYPWMVSIQYSYKDDQYNRKHSCSGSLIRNTYPAAVLTAGHCVGPKIFGETGRIYYADIGRTYPHHINKSGDNFTTLRAFYYYTAAAYLSQQIGATTNLLTDYDLGILLLDGSVEDIEVIPLYDPTNLQHTSQCCEDNQVVRAFGYGYVNNENKKSETLRYLDMRYMSNVYNCSELVIECVEENSGFQDTSYKDNIAADGSAVCAYSKGAGICQGDSGGPLVFYDRDNNIIQVGIGSQSCCMPGVPNMFATVDFFYETIQQALGDETGWLEYLNNNTLDVYNGTNRNGYVEAVKLIHVCFAIILAVLLQ